MKRISILLLGLLLFYSAYAHGDLDARIQKVTDEIQSYPDSAYLFLKRGELFYQHEEYGKSILDFKKCTSLNYSNPRLYFAYAKSYIKQEEFALSLTFIDQILSNNELNVKALRLRGQVLYIQYQFDEAAKSFEMVITHSEKTFPYNYLEASLAHIKSNHEDAVENAIKCIEYGIKDLGELNIFYIRLIELYLSDKNYRSALEYHSKMLANTNRKEKLLYKRALTYIKMGDINAAKLDLEMSLTAIEELPQRIKNNKAMKDLKSNVLQTLENL